MPEINTKGTICFNTMLLKLNMKLIHYFNLSNLSTGVVGPYPHIGKRTHELTSNLHERAAASHRAAPSHLRTAAAPNNGQLSSSK